MPTASPLALLMLLTAAAAQESVHPAPAMQIASTAAVAGAPLQAVVSFAAGATPAAVVDVGRSGPASVPPAPAPSDQRFSVPEAQTLLLVGASLVLIAVAGRRVRISTVSVR